MVLTKSELVAELRTEVRILLHLVGKVDDSSRDYRPTPAQRSTLELINYLTMMGPTVVEGIAAGAFDEPAWTAAEQRAMAQSLEEARDVLAVQGDRYAALIGAMPEESFRDEIELFGERASRGVFLVKWTLGGSAAYRTQLFLYLKACGHDELTSANLWYGVDAPAAA